MRPEPRLPGAASDAGLTFSSGPDSKVFRFEYEGETRPLREVLLSRYRHGRGQDWRETFYPDRVRLNGAPVERRTCVSAGDTIAYLHRRDEESRPTAALPVLYEDEWTLVLHKPDDRPVSPSGLYYFTCLAVRAREEFGNPELTPIHRLDLETSGPLVFAKRSRDLKRFHRLFAAKTLRKVYRALVRGWPAEHVSRIAGKIVPCRGSAIETKLCLEPGSDEDSLTRILRVARHGALSEVELEPVTGKTNQLRVHLAHIGCPIVGDKKYHPDERVFLDWVEHRDFARVAEALLLPRQALQCEWIEFPHPITGAAVQVRALPGSWAAKMGTLARSAFDGAAPGVALPGVASQGVAAP